MTPRQETNRAFVIGHPITHSRSPKLHGFWLKKYAIAGTYEALDVAPESLDRFLDRLRAGEFAGGNVTIPHKEAILPLCDAVDEIAATIGAVNTLNIMDGRIIATNTDHLGFLGNLDQIAPGWDSDLEHTVVFGAGGASRAILYALKSRGVHRISLLNRTLSRAEQLAEKFGPTVQPYALDDFNGIASTAGLIVNTSSIGMHGTSFEDLDLKNLPKTSVVNDCVYTPLVTPLLHAAKHLGLKTVDGLGMLLHQAVPGFRAWFGVTPEVSPALRRLIEQDLTA